MVALYVSLIQKGLRVAEQVPFPWKTDVEKELAKLEEAPVA